MDNVKSSDKPKKVAFIYLTPASGEYYATEELGYNVQRRPQLGLQYLSAVLRKRKVETNIFDQTTSFFDLDWLIKELTEYDLAGFYCSDPQENKIKTYCKKIKEKLDIPILVGGPSTLANSTFLDHGCDMVVHGEGEITIQEIVEHYDGKRGREGIKGISYKRDGKIVKALPQELIKNLDELPFPDRSKINMNLYYDYFLFGMKKPYATVITSRGCMYRCAFCTSCRIWGYKYRIRSADNVLLEIDELVERHAVKYIAFQDDVFGINNDWIEEFCEKLIKRPYRIRWMAIVHPFSMRKDTERILKMMKKAGCDTLSFGLQSAHPEILKNIHRNPSEPRQLKKILRVANKLDLVTAVSYIFGLPGDTRETIQTTADYSLTCGSTLASYYMLSVLGGSEIERLYKDKEICSLTKEEVQKSVAQISKKFYTKPAKIFRIAYFVIKNPAWLIKVGIGLPSILARAGFARMKDHDVFKRT